MISTPTTNLRSVGYSISETINHLTWGKEIQKDVSSEDPSLHVKGSDPEKGPVVRRVYRTGRKSS